MEFLGYFLAFAIGITLGLIGGGGSILTLPVLVYVFAVNEIVATSYSLFIVGLTAIVGGIKKMTSGQVNLRAVIFFGLPSVIAVLLTRKFIIPSLPDILFTIGSIAITKEKALMLFFAFLMLISCYSFIKKKQYEPLKSIVKQNYILIIIEGILVGIITGLVGAGGGFIIVPALVILGKLPMKIAVGTSLIIIALKSLIGFFLGDYFSLNIDIDWELLMLFSLFSISGVFLGNYLSKKISGIKLKRAFGYFLVTIAIALIIIEISKL